jgi:hypothetical protein
MLQTSDNIPGSESTQVFSDIARPADKFEIGWDLAKQYETDSTRQLCSTHEDRGKRTDA